MDVIVLSFVSMKITELENIPGMAIFVDFKKAFDTVDWNFLFKTLEALRADVSKYRPEVYKSEKSKILKKIHKVALGKLLT